MAERGESGIAGGDEGLKRALPAEEVVVTVDGDDAESAAAVAVGEEVGGRWRKGRAFVDEDIGAGAYAVVIEVVVGRVVETEEGMRLGAGRLSG